MPRARPFLLLFALFACATLHAYAYADELNGEAYQVPPPPEENVPPPEPLPPPSVGEQPLPGDEEEPAPRRVPVPKPDPRFTTGDTYRFAHWLDSLCRESAVDAGVAERVKFSFGKPREFHQPENKFGSLDLMLQSYTELAKYRDDCSEERKKDPKACVIQGHVPRPWLVKLRSKKHPWLNFGSQGFWASVLQNRTPAGITPNTDLMRASEEQLKQLQASLKKNFFEVRDIADLNGLSGSGDKAEKVLELVHNNPHCGTRSIAKHDQPVRAPAEEDQK